MALNATLGQFDLIDIYRAFHPKSAGYMFSSSAYGIFSRIDHILGQNQASVNSRLKLYQAYFLTTMA